MTGQDKWAFVSSNIDKIGISQNKRLIIGPIPEKHG